MTPSLLRYIHPSLLLAAFSWLAAAPVAAQTALTGGIRGSVTEVQTGDAIPGVEVELESDSLAYRQRTRSDAQGRFVFLGLTPGVSYRVSASHEGFQPWRREAVEVASEQITPVTVVLRIGELREEVLVMDYASPIESARQEIGQTIDSQKMLDVPLANRNPQRLALLNPQVRNAAALGADGFATNRLSINAQSFSPAPEFQWTVHWEHSS